MSFVILRVSSDGNKLKFREIENVALKICLLNSCLYSKYEYICLMSMKLRGEKIRKNKSYSLKSNFIESQTFIYTYSGLFNILHNIYLYLLCRMTGSKQLNKAFR